MSFLIEKMNSTNTPVKHTENLPLLARQSESPATQHQTLQAATKVNK